MNRSGMPMNRQGSHRYPYDDPSLARLLMPGHAGLPGRSSIRIPGGELTTELTILDRAAAASTPGTYVAYSAVGAPGLKPYDAE